MAQKKFPALKLVLNPDMVGRLDLKEKVMAIHGFHSIHGNDDLSRKEHALFRFQTDDEQTL